MNEIVEVAYQWHQGTGFKAISRSLGFDRKTVRKYVQLAQMAGITRGGPFPDETALISRFKDVMSSSLLRERPAQDVLTLHREWMGETIKAEHMTATQVWRLLREKADIAASYPTVKRCLRAQFQFGGPSVCVRLEVDPGQHPGAGGLWLCGLDGGSSEREESSCMGLHRVICRIPPQP